MRGSSAPHSGPDSLAEPAAGRPCLLGSLARQLLGNPGLAARHALKLATNLGRIAAGEAPMPLPADRRFSAAEWRDHPLHRRAVQAWLAGGAQISAWLADSDLDPVERQRAQYLAEQLGDALAPSNTPLHPQVLRRALDSRGASIANGLRNLRQDLLHNRGLPRQVAADAFEPGRDIVSVDRHLPRLGARGLLFPFGQACEEPAVGLVGRVKAWLGQRGPGPALARERLQPVPGAFALEPVGLI